MNRSIMCSGKDTLDGLPKSWHVAASFSQKGNTHREARSFFHSQISVAAVGCHIASRSQICEPVIGRELLDKRRQRDAQAVDPIIDATNSPRGRP